MLLRASRTGRYRRQRQSSSQVAWPDSVITIDDVLKADDRFSKHRTESLWRDVMRKVCTELLFVDVVRKGCAKRLCERFVRKVCVKGCDGRRRVLRQHAISIWATIATT